MSVTQSSITRDWDARAPARCALDFDVVHIGIATSQSPVSLTLDLSTSIINLVLLFRSHWSV